MGMRRTVVGICGGVVWWLVSCREVPAPEGGILSVSPIRLPLPGLVAGDTMRDSAGFVAPLRVVAYNVDGDSVANVPTSFVALDTGARVAGAFLIGETAGTTVRVVGNVAALQTQPASVRVTLAPDTITAADSVRHVRPYSLLTGDTVVNSADLTTIVQNLGATTTGVDAVIVYYTIVQAPPANANGPSVVLMNGTIPSSRDTTSSGRAARSARLRLAAFPGVATDSAIITATASHRGSTLGTVQFIVIFLKQ
jgi:hypothetical protein